MMRALGFALRTLALIFAITLVVSAGALGWRMVAPVEAAPAPVGVCTEIMLASNGWHTDIVFPATILPAEHPLRRLFPAARTLAVGWGDRDAYRTGGEEPWRHAVAMIPPRPSVLHVAADTGWTGARVAISEAGARGLAAYLADAMRRGADGGAIIVSPGYVRGRSQFVEGQESFHVFNLCNHWTARALRAAGLPVSDFGAWTAQSVTRQVRDGPVCS